MANEYHPTTCVPAPTQDTFTARFGYSLPQPQYLTTDLGQTAIYSLPAQNPAQRQILIVHGVNTPALGLLELAQQIQTLSPSSHIILYDLWGHGLSSSPGVQHSPEIFQQQICDVLTYLAWTSVDLVGYSFGGSTAVRFAAENPGTVNSLTILAPAGLLNQRAFSAEIEEVLIGTATQEQAEQRVFDVLEGGELKVPDDWEASMKSGRIVAQALRRFELDEHRGFRRSVTSMFRHGGIFGCKDIFGRVEGLAILGETDDVCDLTQLQSLGWKDVRIVKGAGHDVPRSHAEEVAKIVVDSWKET